MKSLSNVNISDCFNDYFSNRLAEKIFLSNYDHLHYLKCSNTVYIYKTNQKFTQLIKNSTRITELSSTLIDLIASNNPSSIAATIVYALSLSDHDMVGCIRKINNIRYPMRTIHCRNFKNFNSQDLNNDIDEIDWKPLYDSSNVENAVNYLNHHVKAIFDKHAPSITKKVKGRPCPWLTEDIKVDMNKRDQVLRKARNSNNPTDWSTYKKLLGTEITFFHVSFSI